ncbi:right-handed parallel beta-helix repeat-containing protein [Aquimarina sp. U1-2]|uniref:right-handed parallel beta-helix repeat-containing protein n=1 Tax=Aquimarina sp. U1-2 TaxID=2823141 RepID=UPI001AEC8E56|nr:Calx-beta domain-containing protein [Aquimarina sp. U1-2]MBP2834041.1 right-handed parallel beta-helix repeat-containing protein [Aquimarina sp. U1-2]
MKIFRKVYIKIFLVLLFTFPVQKGLGQDTFFDNFNPTNTYADNDGNQNFSTNWLETNDDGLPTNPGNFNARRIYINNGQINFNLQELTLINLDNASIERRLDLSTYSVVDFSYSYDSRFRQGEIFIVEMYNSTTNSYQIVDFINFGGIGTRNYQLSAAQASNDARVRFRGFDQNWAGNAAFFIDNVRFTAYNRRVFVNDVTVNENAGIITFTARYEGSTVAAFTVDYSTVDGTAFADGDYIAQTGTLNFSGAPNQEVSFSVPITNDVYSEGTENFTIDLTNVNDSSIGLVDGRGIIEDTDSVVVPVNPDLELLESFNGAFDYGVAGGTFRTADDGTDPCAVTNTSSGILTNSGSIPNTAAIEKAYLFWAHSKRNPNPNITFEGQPVIASTVNQSAFGGGAFYGYVSDVTTIVQSVSNPFTNSYTLTNLDINTGDPYCGGPTVLGAWSLMVFYSDTSFPTSRINLYNGFSGERFSNSSFTLDNFFAINPNGAKTTVLSWEGDETAATSVGEELSITSPLPPEETTSLEGDGDNVGGNNRPFNSTIYDGTSGVNQTGTYGIDLDTYDLSSILRAGESTITTNVASGLDFVIVNSVVLKVPSNLITGIVFEDINYPGGPGRNLATTSGAGIPNAELELYRENPAGTGIFVLEDRTTTNASGQYVFAGMQNGTYKVRVVNTDMESTRGGGDSCTECLPVQTFRRNFASGGIFTDVVNEIGGANPAATSDTPAVTTNGTLLDANAQTVSDVTITDEGADGLDFGFNFNTIVNTNADGQGSLAQFIINSNNLDQIGLDIEAHPNDGTLNPSPGDDTSIFMIPSNADPLGRAGDARYNIANGYFDILATTNLPQITDANTKIDGRTQTAYSGNTNTNVFGTSGTVVGTSSTSLPVYNAPEVQVQRSSNDDSFVFEIAANNITIRNLGLFANQNNADAIRIASGSNVVVQSNIIGPNLANVVEGNTRHGIRINGGDATITNNYIAQNRITGIRVNGNPTTTITLNQFTANSSTICNDQGTINIRGGTNTIENNLIEDSGIYGIRFSNGTITIRENTITGSGQNPAPLCNENAGIALSNGNSTTLGNVINANEGAGIIVTGGTTSRISQNSIFANGTALAPALGIDINDDGVTLNDPGDSPTGPNNQLNFPVIESSSISGNTLRVAGWSRPGTTIEFFVSDISTGAANPGENQVPNTLNQDYGEGQTFLASRIEGSPNDNDTTISAYSDSDGNADTTDRFDFSIVLSTPIPVGSIITATATFNNATSEFGPIIDVGAATVISNRRITYRVKQN